SWLDSFYSHLTATYVITALPLHAALPILSAGPRAEQRSADSDHGRALGDRRLEIVRHAHRERVDRWMGLTRALEQRAHAPERLAAAVHVGGGGGNRHQAAQAQRGLRGDGFGERRDRIGRATRFGRFIVDVHLHEDVQRCAARWPMPRQWLDQPGAVQAL